VSVGHTEDVSPRPQPASSPLAWLLDVRHDVERELLVDWLTRHDSGPAHGEAVIALHLGDDRRGIDVVPLRRLLDLPEDTLIVPLRVAWTLPESVLAARPRLRDLLFGDPRQPGLRRAQRIRAREPQRMHLLSGEPATLANLRQRLLVKRREPAHLAPDELAVFIGRQAAIVLDIAERSLQGSRYKVPRYVAESLAGHPDLTATLEVLSQQRNIPMHVLRRESAAYMKEMISIPRMFWLDVFAQFNRFCLRLGYEPEIVVDGAELDTLRTALRDYPSMVLWTHKTYLDGMVVPKLFYDHDFPMPHLFGGANVNFAGIGFLLKRSGAIFIKRSFRDNDVYKVTLRQYIGYLMEKRFPMTWSFEGTRSRLGKLMPPKFGLLKYVLEACHASAARAIHIVPVSISYDLIRDVEEYATEQTGRGKGAESLRWFVGYVRSLTRPMGRIYVNIGQPVVLEQAPDPEDSLALAKIAFEVAVEANRVTPLTLPSLVTMSLLGAAPRAITEGELIDDLDALLRYAAARKLRLSSDCDQSFRSNLHQRLRLLLAEGIVSRYDEGPDTVYGIALEQHPIASYYRNTVIHFFINKAIIEQALIKASEGDPTIGWTTFWTEVDKLRSWFKFEFFYAPSVEFQREIRAELAQFDPDWESAPLRGPGGFTELLLKMTPLVSHVALLTYAEAYSIVADLLARVDAQSALGEDDCVNTALKLGRQAYLQRRISSEASIGRLLFRNGYQMLQHLQLTGPGDAGLAARRVAIARELRDLIRRLEIVRAIGMSGRERRRDTRL